MSNPTKFPRRRFLQSAFGAPLAATLGPKGARALGLLAQAPAEELFPNPQIIRYDAQCFTLRGRDTFIYSAAFHYPRCPRALWRDRLVKLERAGYNTIETYVFWNYHEPREGQADLSEFEDFLRLVRELGFWMIVRPGPYVCAEWDAGGFPHWVVAQRFPLRSNHPRSIETSRHWFNQVMPIIARHQVTHTGPIIMVQIENEYDYWGKLEDAEKRDYIRALAQTAWGAGIDVPLITCWTRQARENSDPDMARIMDTCNFYPRWAITTEVPPALEKLRREEPASPLGISELQGGWFSELGGKLSVDQEGVDAAQYNMLAKTALEQGVTYFSTYMAFGGTNFDWAAKKLTTSYDYAAPLREPGGLWEKYYAARGLGAFLAQFGGVLTRSKPAASPAESTSAQVSVTARENGPTGALFVRENSNADERFKMSFPDPASPTHRRINVPREGELALGAREMKALPVQVEIPGGALRYSTAEVLAAGHHLDRQFLIVYDQPGRLVEIGLATRSEPHVEGETEYQYWDSDYESVIIGLRVASSEKLLLLNNHLLLILLPRERALRTWIGQFPRTAVPGPFQYPGEEALPISVPFISDARLIGETGSFKNRLWAELDFAPGEHPITTLLPPLPSKLHIDGVPAEFEYDRHWQVARAQVTTPAVPAQAWGLDRFALWVEKASQLGAEVLSSPARPLEELGPLPYGYVRYSAQFNYQGEPKMFVSTFADDEKKLFVNGRLVAEASNAKPQAEFSLGSYARSGTNALEIFYELFGSPNFGENLGELKGLESVRLGSDLASSTLVNPWQIQRRPAAMRGAELDPNFSIGGWTQASLGARGGRKEIVPAIAWCRAEFALEAPPAGWWFPWKVSIEATRDALLYLNGKFVGRYVTRGPQKDFYLPEPYLVSGGRAKNLLTIGLAYADDASPITRLRVEPYVEFALRRTRLEFQW